MTYFASARKRRFAITAYLCAMTYCNLTLVSREIAPLKYGLQDFTIYYMAARLLRQGGAAAIYDMGVQYRTQMTFARIPSREDVKPFNHPPFEALLFVPFTFLRYWPAYLAWTLLSLIMIAVSAVLLRRLPKIRDLPPLLLALGSVTFFPVVMGLLMGQDTALLLLLSVLALTCLYRGSDAAAGAWLAAGLFRPHIVLPFVLLLAARRGRVLLGFAPVALMLAGISAAIVGWRWPLTYVQFVLQRERPHGGFGPHDLSTLRGLICVLPGIKDSGVLAGLLVVAASLAVFAAAAHRIRSAKDAMAHSFCLAGVTAILVSLHAFSYDLTLLLPLVLFILSAAVTGDSGEQGTERLVVLFVLFLTPLYIYLVMGIQVFSLFSLALLWLYFRLLGMRAPAGEPA